MRTRSPQSRLVMLFAVLSLAHAQAASLLAADDDKVWKELGSREVSFKTSNDTFEVGEGGGKFTALRIMVDNGNLDIFSIVVTFGNGERFEPKTKMSFKEGQRSHSIDFPGGPRVIQKVDLQYKSTQQEGRAKIYLHGRPAKE